MRESDIEQLEAQHGQKMIEVKIRFWTNDIAPEKGKIRPKHAWASGVVRMESNASHGIAPGNPLPFHSLLDIGSVIEKALIAHGVCLHLPRRMRKYITDGEWAEGSEELRARRPTTVRKRKSGARAS